MELNSENNFPKISIIINNYNYERYVGRAISSALSQDYSNFEVIIVDDGSTDRSLEVIRSFSDHRITVIAKTNGGQNSAIAAGLAASSSDYILILDSDDALSVGALSAIADAAMRDNSCGIFYRLKMVDVGGRRIGSLPQLPFLKHNLRSSLYRYGSVNHAPTSGCSFRSDFIKFAFSFVDQKESFSSDGYLAWAAAWENSISVIDKELGEYLVHGANHSTVAVRSDHLRIKNTKYTLWHYRHLSRYIFSKTSVECNFKSLIGAYAWREIAYFKSKSGEFSEFTWWECIRFGVAMFLKTDQFSLFKRVKNVAFLMVSPLFGRYFRMRGAVD